MVDRIEDEVAKAVDHVDHGKKELAEAGDKKRKARKVGNIIYDISVINLLDCFHCS